MTGKRGGSEKKTKEVTDKSARNWRVSMTRKAGEIFLQACMYDALHLDGQLRSDFVRATTIVHASRSGRMLIDS